MNPSRDKHQHALTWDGACGEPDLKVLKSTSPFYRLTADAGQAIIDEVTAVVVTWRDRASALGISRLEIRAMEAVFAV
jgi:serine/threonine-protein kinase HipA